MRKLWILGVIGALALLPFSALAHEGGSASATVLFESVINTVVDGSGWGDLTIDQDDIAGWAGATFPIDWDTDPVGTPDITVTVYALTNYKVYASYYADKGESFFDPSNQVIYLAETGGGGFSGYLEYEEITNPAAGGTGAGMTDISFTGGPNNLPNGDTKKYDVKWNPGSINSDLDKSETITFTIVFIVTDTDT